jgi:hypothetical protein
MYKKRSAEEIRQEIKEVSEQMVKDMEQYTNSPQQVKEMLDFMAKFHQYSFRNQVMIRSQREGATAVGSFKKFKDLGYSVKKGEKGIKIWAPSTATIYQYRDAEGKLIAVPAKQADARIKNLAETGQAIKKQLTRFRLVSVFDATQTNMPAKDYPKLYPNRPIDYSSDKTLVKELSDATSSWLRRMDVDEIDMSLLVESGRVKDKGQKGLSVPGADHQMVAIKDDLPESDKIAVRIHEMAHNALHQDHDDGKTTAVREFQAEMTSYVVSKHFGLDTSENATSYIAAWTHNGQTLHDLDPRERAHILSDVQATAKTFIDDISTQLERLRDERALDHEINNDGQDELDHFVEKYNRVKVWPQALSATSTDWKRIYRDDLAEDPLVYFGHTTFNVTENTGRDHSFSATKYYNVDTEQFEYHLPEEFTKNSGLTTTVINRDYPLPLVTEDLPQPVGSTVPESNWLIKKIREVQQAEISDEFREKLKPLNTVENFIRTYNREMEPSNDGWATPDPENKATYHQLTPELLAEDPRVFMGLTEVKSPRPQGRSALVPSFYNTETERLEFDVPRDMLAKNKPGTVTVNRIMPIYDMIERMEKPSWEEDTKEDSAIASDELAYLMKKQKESKPTKASKKDLALQKAMTQKGLER